MFNFPLSFERPPMSSGNPVKQLKCRTAKKFFRGNAMNYFHFSDKPINYQIKFMIYYSLRSVATPFHSQNPFPTGLEKCSLPFTWHYRRPPDLFISIASIFLKAKRADVNCLNNDHSHNEYPPKCLTIALPIPPYHFIGSYWSMRVSWYLSNPIIFRFACGLRWAIVHTLFEKTE